MASVGTLSAVLTLNDEQYKRALEANSARTAGFVRGIAGAFARVAAPVGVMGGLALAARSAGRYAEQVVDGAAAVGLSLKEYQALDHLFRQNGASGEHLAAVITKLRTSVADAAQGSRSARAAFEAIGVPFQSLLQLSPAELLAEVARGMRRSEGDTIAFSAAADILGSKNLPKLNAALKQLAAEGLAQVVGAAPIVSDENLRRVDEAKQKIENIGRAAERTSTTITGELLRGLDQVGTITQTNFRTQRRFDELAIDLERRRALALRGREQAEIAEERRIMRRAVAYNEERRRVEEVIAAVNSRYGAAPGRGRNGPISPALLDRAAAVTKRREIEAQRDALDAQLEIVRKQQEIFQRGLSFTAANDPFIALSESIREANLALESGVVTAIAYQNAIKSAATAFGAARLQELQDQGALAGIGGQSGKASTFTRTEAYARRLAAQGKYEEAANQINYLKSLDPALGSQLETALGMGAVAPATAQASRTQQRAKALEEEVASLVKSIDAIAKKLTVS